MKAYRDLHDLDPVLDVTIFGNELHLLVDNNYSDEQLGNWLTEHGFKVSQLKGIEPSLEDVFVSLTQAAQQRQLVIQQKGQLARD
jgi:ABC-2 type transport system ATP-binding protein